MSAKRVGIALVGGRGYRSNYGGVENAIRQLANEMVKLSVEPIWVPGRGECTTFSVETEGTLRALSVPGWISCFGHSVTTLIGLLYLLMRVRPRVVYLFASGPCLLSIVSRAFGVRTIACLRAIDSARDGWHGINRWVLRSGEWAAVNMANHCTVNSLAMQRLFARRGRDTVYIPNGITPAGDRRPNLLAELSLKPDGYVFCAARLDPVKRLHILLQAHRQLPESCRLPLVIAGGHCKDASYELALKRDAGKDVHFLGHISQDEVQTLTQYCAVFVLPSILEGMSNSLLAALGAGRPVLCADVEENADVVNGFCHALFEADNVVALSEKLLALTQDNRRRRLLGARLKRISSQYDWGKSAEAFLRLG